MTDILDSVLNLEEDYYTLGHTEGSLAGATAGRLEGRAFGIEKGFEKYLTLGIIKGRTKIWQSRTSPSLQSSSPSSLDPPKIIITNPRHLKHLELLQTLSTTPPIRNEEDDVEEVDDRIRRGKAKVKILENTLREGVPLDEDEITLFGQNISLPWKGEKERLRPLKVPCSIEIQIYPVPDTYYIGN
ncbi:hypothetical protein TWF225_002330 [Orbilia oligospora]|nr:hypothetical protein TWF751_002638 [Orbilia oligospora]KAF3163066.1 hypothetical protein TWF225_002330 [Orbilia oligospora]